MNSLVAPSCPCSCPFLVLLLQASQSSQQQVHPGPLTDADIHRLLQRIHFDSKASEDGEGDDGHNRNLLQRLYFDSKASEDGEGDDGQKRNVWGMVAQGSVVDKSGKIPTRMPHPEEQHQVGGEVSFFLTQN